MGEKYTMNLEVVADTGGSVRLIVKVSTADFDCLVTKLTPEEARMVGRGFLEEADKAEMGLTYRSVRSSGEVTERVDQIFAKGPDDGT